MKSDKRKKLMAEKRSRKAKAMTAPGGNSVYARKKRGIYPPNSPYLSRWAEYA